MHIVLPFPRTSLAGKQKPTLHSIDPLVVGLPVGFNIEDRTMKKIESGLCPGGVP